MQTLHYATLHYTTLHYTTLHYTTLHCTALHYTTLHCTTLHYTKLHYTTLHYTTTRYLYMAILPYPTSPFYIPGYPTFSCPNLTTTCCSLLILHFLFFVFHFHFHSLGLWGLQCRRTNGRYVPHTGCDDVIRSHTPGKDRGSNSSLGFHLTSTTPPKPFF